MLTARMFSTLYLAFVFAAGVVGTARLLKRYPLGAMEILIIGGGVGFVAVHGLIFGAILFLPFKAASKGVLVLCGGYVLYTLSRLLKDGDLYRWGLSVQKQFSRESNIMHAKTLAVFLALVGLVSWYANVYLNTLVYAKGTYAAAFAGIGDVPYHLTQIARLATGDHVVLDDPIYAGIPLTYPFFINFMSAVLRRLGAPLILAYHFPGFYFGCSSIILLYFIFKRLSHRRWLAFGGVALTLFSFNTRYVLLAKDAFFAVRHTLRETLLHLAHLPFSVATVWDASFPNQHVDAPSLLPLFLLHQRASIMGFWTLAAIVLLWLALVQSDVAAYEWTETLPLGILLALFPLLHTHGFVALCIAAAGWIGSVFVRKEKRLQGLLFSLLWTVPFLVWQLAFLLGPNAAYTFKPQFRLGWMTDLREIGGLKPDPSGREALALTWIRFMWQNFGLLLPAAMLALGAAWRWRKHFNADHFWFFVPGSMLIFTLANTVKLQVWDADTNKLFAFDIFFGAAVLVLVCAWWAERWSKMALGLFSLLVAMAIPTGILDVYSRTTLLQPYTPVLFDTVRVSVGDWVAAQTPENAVFITSDDQLNPVNALGGRRVILGFKGWMWTHGIAYGVRDRLIDAFLRDPRNNANVFQVLGPTYVLLDPKWRHDHPDLEGKLVAAFGQSAFSNSPFAIWKLPQ